MRTEIELALACAEMNMVRCLCGLQQIDRYSSISLRVRLGLEDDIISMLRQNGLR